jgi:hypothetical protein
MFIFLAVLLKVLVASMPKQLAKSPKWLGDKASRFTDIDTKWRRVAGLILDT